MLEKVRRPGKAKSWKFYISIVVFGAIILVFAFFSLAPTQSGLQGGGGSAAMVNGKVITISDFRQLVAQQERMMAAFMNSGNQNAAQRERFTNMIRSRALEQLITSEVITQSAEKMGFYSSDGEIRDYIVEIPAFQQDGRFQRENYDRYLSQSRMSSGDFEAKIRKDIVRTRIQSAFSSAFKPSSREQTRDQRADAIKYSVNFAKFNINQLAPKKVTKSKVSAYANNETNISKIKSYYDSNKRDFTSEEQVNAQHILIKFDAGKKDSVNAAFDKITELAKEAKTGDFAELAKKHSQDPGSASKGGNLGFFNRGTMVKEFSEAAFSANVGSITNPVKTQYGYHIIKVLDKKPKATKKIEMVKTEIARKLLEQDEARKTLDRLQADLKKGKRSVSRALKRHEIKWEKTGEFSISSGNIPKIGAVDPVFDKLLGVQKKNTLIPEVVKHRDDYYILEVADVKQEEAKKAVSNNRGGFGQDAFGAWVDNEIKAAKIERSARLAQSASY